MGDAVVGSPGLAPPYRVLVALGGLGELCGETLWARAALGPPYELGSTLLERRGTLAYGDLDRQRLAVA